MTDRQARECRRNEGRRRKVEELLQAGWPSPQILIFWFTGSCPSFLGSCPPHHPASFIPHTFLSLFLYFIANNNPLLVNLTFLSDRYPRVYPDLSSLPVCWSFNTTAVALRNWHNLDSCGTFWKGKESNRLFEDSIISWIRQLFEGKINELPREETFPFRLWNSNLTSFFLPSFFNAMNSWNALCIEKRRVFVHNVYSQLFPS